MRDFARVRKFCRIVERHHRFMLEINVVSYRWRSRDKINAEFTFETLLHNFHMQKSEVSDAESEAQSFRTFGFID
jgi:hypothetical protein